MARALAHNGVKLFGVDINLEAANFTASRLRDEVPDFTKAGLLQYSRHLAALHTADRIRVNCVVPGII